MVQLVELTVDMEDQYMDFCSVLVSEDLRGRWLFEYHGEPFPVLVQKLQDWKQGQQLPKEWVPASTFYLVRDDGKIIGKSSLRHELNEHLQTVGGHICSFGRTFRHRRLVSHRPGIFSRLFRASVQLCERRHEQFFGAFPQIRKVDSCRVGIRAPGSSRSPPAGGDRAAQPLTAGPAPRRPGIFREVALTYRHMYICLCV